MPRAVLQPAFYRLVTLWGKHFLLNTKNTEVHDWNNTRRHVERSRPREAWALTHWPPTPGLRPFPQSLASPSYFSEGKGEPDRRLLTTKQGATSLQNSITSTECHICWICNTVAPSSNPRPRYVNSQLVSLRPVGILNKFTFNLWYLVSAFQVSPISTAVLNTLRLK